MRRGNLWLDDLDQEADIARWRRDTGQARTSPWAARIDFLRRVTGWKGASSHAHSVSVPQAATTPLYVTDKTGNERDIAPAHWDSYPSVYGNITDDETLAVVRRVARALDDNKRCGFDGVLTRSEVIERLLNGEKARAIAASAGLHEARVSQMRREVIERTRDVLGVAS